MLLNQTINPSGVSSGEDLTPYQRSVLELVCQGKNNAEIITAMGFLSPAPLNSILGKLAKRGLIDCADQKQEQLI